MNPLFVGAQVLIALAVAMLTLFVRVRPTQPRPTQGPRGMARHAALARSPGVRALEPVVRWLARFVSRWELPRARPRLTRLLLESGEPLGLDASELIASSFVLGTLLAVGFALIGSHFGMTGAALLAGALLGVVLPFEGLQRHRYARLRAIDRALPATVDILALSISAGTDLVSALESVLDKPTTGHDALEDELRLVVQALRLGQTRRDALLVFRERAPSVGVRDFVAAVVQADTQGTPLATVLETQAKTLRIRRSMLAEEAAARAGVLLLIPLTLLLSCVMLLLFGPLVLSNVGHP